MSGAGKAGEALPPLGAGHLTPPGYFCQDEGDRR